MTSSRIPSGTPVVAGYVDGRFRWSAADWARHAGSRIVRIATSPTSGGAHVLDVERGDALPSQIPAWLRITASVDVTPTVYCSASLRADCEAAVSQAGLPVPLFWLAEWGGPKVLEAGVIARQWVSTAAYDESVCADYWPGVDPPHAPSAPLTRYQLRRGATGLLVQLLQGELHVPADGIFGQITETAVKGFQRTHGLVPDGIVGPLTWRRLDS